MTSKRLYAAAALALSASLPLSACSAGDSPEGEVKPRVSTPAYPQPNYKVTHEQLRSVATVGQRLTDRTNSMPLRSEGVYVGFCDDGFTGSQGRSWFSTDKVIEPGEGVLAGLGGNDSTQIGWTFTAAVVLDDSPSAVRVIDERIRGWSTCQPEDDPPLTTHKVTVPGAAASVVRTQIAKGLSPWNQHRASGVARVENVLVSCTIHARTAKLALGNVTSCLSDMARAMPMAAGQDAAVTDANKVVATKMLIARAAAKGQGATVRERGSASTPCTTSTQTFLPAQAVFGLIQTEVPLDADNPDTAAAPEILGVLTVERLADGAAARAKVATGRKTFGGCRGTYSKGRPPYVQKGKVTGVTDAAFGDGGFTITSTSQFSGQKKVEVVHDSIFSVGPYVVEMAGATPRNAQAIAAQLAAVVGS